MILMKAIITVIVTRSAGCPCDFGGKCYMLGHGSLLFLEILLSSKTHSKYCMLITLLSVCK